MLVDFTQQLQCLHCSNTRSFLHQTSDGTHQVDQREAQQLHRTAVVTCGRCGGASLVHTWDDAIPYADPLVRRRRRSRERRVTRSLASQ
jgi:cytochrome c553